MSDSSAPDSLYPVSRLKEAHVGSRCLVVCLRMLLFYCSEPLRTFTGPNVQRKRPRWTDGVSPSASDRVCETESCVFVVVVD